MYIITRYVVWEVLKIFLAALLALTLVVTPVMVVKEGLGRGLPATVMMYIMPYTLPEMLGITIPASMLFSICSVFGRMTGSNEVVALKSLGISPMTIVWPAIVLAAFLSLGTVWMYELAATWCKPKGKQIVAESLEEIAMSMLYKNRSYSDDAFSITVKRVANPQKPGDRPKLIQPTIKIKGPPAVTITAAEATIQTDWKNRQIQIQCVQSEFDFEGQGRMTFPGLETISKPLPVPQHDRFHRDWVAMRDIPTLIDELQTNLVQKQNELKKLEQFRDASKAMNLPESPEQAQQIAAKRGDVDYFQFRINRLKAEPYRRWANGFTCLCFALLGAPVAMFWRHADVLTNFFVCFLPILAIYYPLLMLSDDFSTSGKLPPISFWMANVTLMIPAVGLLRWIVRH